MKNDDRTIDLLIGHMNGVPEERLEPMFTMPTIRLGPTPVPRSHYFWAAVMGAFVVAAAAVPTIGYMLAVVGYGAP